VQGTLTYTPESGAILRVIGSLESLDKATEFYEYDIINGFTGIEITLYKCFTITAPLSDLYPETL
jgi:hypothetical protein